MELQDNKQQTVLRLEAMPSSYLCVDVEKVDSSQGSGRGSDNADTRVDTKIFDDANNNPQSQECAPILTYSNPTTTTTTLDGSIQNWAQTQTQTQTQTNDMAAADTSYSERNTANDASSNGTAVVQRTPMILFLLVVLPLLI